MGVSDTVTLLPFATANAQVAPGDVIRGSVEHGLGSRHIGSALWVLPGAQMGIDFGRARTPHPSDLPIMHYSGDWQDSNTCVGRNGKIRWMFLLMDLCPVAISYDTASA